METSNGSAADFDPIIVDCSIESCKENILNLIRQQAEHCNIAPENLKLFISKDAAIDDQNWSYHHPHYSIALSIPFSIEISRHNDGIELTETHAKELNILLQKKAQNKLTHAEEEYLNRDIVAIRHELGHKHDAPDRGLIEVARKWSFGIANTCMWLLLCQSIFPQKNFYDKVAIPVIGLCCGHLANGLAASLYSKTYESRADDFAIKYTKDAKLLKSRADKYKQLHNAEKKTFLARCNQLIELFAGIDTHPSDCSRYKKFQKAYEKRLPSNP